MTTVAAPVSAPAPDPTARPTRVAVRRAPLRAALAELRGREPRLTAFGLACLACAAAALLAPAIDPRLLGGVSVWAKPAKFFASVAVFALTWAWFVGLVRPERRGARLVRASASTLLVAAAFELAYITAQAARAQPSHFNTGDPWHAAMYALMGVGAVALVGTSLPLAWEIARRPAAGADPEYQRAVVLGLVLTVVLGGVVGGYLSAQAGHAVGAESGHLPGLGWNRTGGDLRVAHLFGMHAMQALPLASVAAARLGGRRRRLVGWLTAVLWTALTLGAFAQAVAGRPFPLG